MRPADSFAPGPWSVRQPGPDIIGPGGDLVVSLIVEHDMPDDMADATYRLIASAPDLLAALTDAAIRCAGRRGERFREHRCVDCSKWLDVIEKAVAP